MRIMCIIIVLAGIALALVQLRRREITVRHEIQRLQSQGVVLRRKLWDQQVKLGYLTAPGEVNRRVMEFAMKAKARGDRLAKSPTHYRD